MVFHCVSSDDLRHKIHCRSIIPGFNFPEFFSHLVMATVSAMLQPLILLVFLPLYWAVLVPSHVQFFGTPWNIACQAPLSMDFYRQEYWSELPFPSPGHLSDPGIEPGYSSLQADSLPFEPPWKEAPCTEQLPLKWCMEDSCLRCCHLRKCIYLKFIIRQFILV